MKRETIDSYIKWSARPFKALAHIDADIMIDFAEYFADEQLKKKMPSKQKISKTANTYGIYSMEVEAFVDGIRWLKQQILKP